MTRVLVYKHRPPVVIVSGEMVTHTVVLGEEMPIAVLDADTDDLSAHLTPTQIEDLKPHLSKRPAVI